MIHNHVAQLPILLFYIYFLIFIIFYHSLNIVRIIKHTILKRAEHIARMGEGRSTFKILTSQLIGKA